VEDVRDPAADEPLLGLPLLVCADRLGGGAIDVGSGFGSAVAMPPIGTAPRFREIATSRRKMFARKGVVLMSTPNRSGPHLVGIRHDELEDRALRSQRAALSPAA